MKKKVLFISYFWPPSGKASLHWPLDVIRHLPKDEIEPIILTIDEDTFSQKDESLLRKVDPNWVVLKSKALEPFNIYRKFIGKKKEEKLVASESMTIENKNLPHRISLWIRLNLFIPDARIGWHFTAVPKGKEFLAKNKVDAIVSIGPPHSSHLIGLRLSKAFSIPHIPVLMDPWVDIIYYKNLKRSTLTKRIDNHFEKSVLSNARQVVFVTKSTEEDYLNKYSFLKGKTNVLYWGYDEDDFKDAKVEKIRRDEKIIVHAGNLFAYQNPKNLWKQLKIEIDNGNKYKIRFIGTVNQLILDSIKEAGLENHAEYVGFLPYREMVRQILEADMLLVCASEPRHVPGKLFESLRSGNPIIAFGDNNEEVKNIIQESNAGMMFSYSENVGEFFRKYYNFIRNNLAANQFNREKISKDFNKLISSL